MAKCNFILNIHGWFEQSSQIFEHIRCDRLLEAGFKVLSEDSYYMDKNYLNKYPNLTMIPYEWFFKLDDPNIDIISQLKNKKKIFDCFIYNDEIEILKLRLEKLYNHVDYFVIVEYEKDVYTSKDIINKYENKIIHIKLSNENLDNQLYDGIAKGLDVMPTNSRDIIFISNVNEIIDPIIIQIINSSTLTGILALNLPYYDTKLEKLSINSNQLPKVTTIEYYNRLITNQTISQIRLNNASLITNDCGWCII
jgi:hypothetical protein